MRLRQLRQFGFDPRQHWRRSELGGDPLRFREVLDGQRIFLLGLVKTAHDHFAAGDHMTIRIKLGIFANPAMSAVTLFWAESVTITSVSALRIRTFSGGFSLPEMISR